jgi:glycosyltransferase involved in cell wall biosynthesis
MIILNIITAFLVLRVFISLANLLSNPRLRKFETDYDDKVSILVPVRNEEKNIIPLLESLESQDYKNIEVIVLDDKSSDNTKNLVEKFIEKRSNFKLVEGKSLPKEWLGKPWACHQLSEEATGKYFLFIDADVRIRDGAIGNSLRLMKIKYLSLFSLYPNQIMKTSGEKMVVPLINYILLSLLPLRLVFQSHSTAFAAASGQYMMFSAYAYKEFKWHEQVKLKVTEDTEIMRLVKKQLLKGKTYLGSGMVECRMYSGYKDAIEGFSKNLFAGFGYNVLAIASYIFFILFAYLFTIPYLTPGIIAFHVGMILVMRICISILSNQNVLFNVVCHPIQLISKVYIAFNSVKGYYLGTTEWKGRRIHT